MCRIMPGADGDRLTGCIMMIRDKAVPLSLRGCINDNQRQGSAIVSTGVYGLTGRRKTGYIKRPNVQNGKCINGR